MKYRILILLMILSAITYGQPENSKTTPLDSLKFESIYTYAIRGEMDTVFKILNVTKDSWLTPDQQKLKSNYYKRFISNSEDFNYKTDNPVIVDMFKRYQY